MITSRKYKITQTGRATRGVAIFVKMSGNVSRSFTLDFTYLTGTQVRHINFAPNYNTG